MYCLARRCQDWRHLVVAAPEASPHRLRRPPAYSAPVDGGLWKLLVFALVRQQRSAALWAFLFADGDADAIYFDPK